jgi:hypothetical protein
MANVDTAVHLAADPDEAPWKQSFPSTIISPTHGLKPLDTLESRKRYLLVPFKQSVSIRSKEQSQKALVNCQVVIMEYPKHLEYPLPVYMPTNTVCLSVASEKCLSRKNPLTNGCFQHG